MFKNKNEAKYFITVIGDAINKSNTSFNDLTFIISYKAKFFLREIANLIWIYTGINILNHIKKYDNIFRIIYIKIKKNIYKIFSNFIKSALKKIGIFNLIKHLYLKNKKNKFIYMNGKIINK